jgi:hypothetical protein
MQGFERDTLMVVFNSKRVWLVHLVANALLMIAFFYWTRIPEETGWYVALTLVGGLLIAFATLCLHSATLDYFGVSSERCFANRWMGAAFTALIPAEQCDAPHYVLRLALDDLVPLLLPVARVVIAHRRTGCDEELSRICERRRVSSDSPLALLDRVSRLLRNRGLHPVHACMDGPAQIISAK